MHARIHGSKITQTFEEVFEEYAEEIEVPISPETATLMDKLAAEKFKELEDKWLAQNS